MPRPDFSSLRRDLRHAGVSPREIRRTEAELRDHFDDLVEAARRCGVEQAAAERQALRQLGEFPDLVQLFSCRRELKSWPYRYRRLALLVYPVACVLLLPAAPVLAGVAHAPLVARWGLSVFLGGLVTATILLVLQLLIVLS